MTEEKKLKIRAAAIELASSNIVVDALARFLEQVIIEVVTNIKDKKKNEPA